MQEDLTAIIKSFTMMLEAAEKKAKQGDVVKISPFEANFPIINKQALQLIDGSYIANIQG